MNDSTKNPLSTIDLTCFNWVKLLTQADINYHAKYLGLYLSTFMNLNQDMAFPSLARIETETGLGHATVLKYLKLLQTEGWILKQSGSRVQSNRYKITIPTPVLERVTGRSGDDVGREVTYVASEDYVGREATSNNNRITKGYIGFGEIWPHYPRKVGKAAAEKAWNRLKPDEDLFTKILCNIQSRQARGEWSKDRQQFIPHMATYLNGKRWEDEAEDPQARQPLQHLGTTRGRSLQEDLTDTSWA